MAKKLKISPAKGQKVSDIIQIDENEYITLEEHEAKYGGRCDKRSVDDFKHQNHYESLEIQPIEICLANLDGYQIQGALIWNIYKYLGRAPAKGGTDDYKKALVYLAWLIEYCETGTINLEGD